MPKSDACPTGDQEVMGSIPAASGNILSWRFIMKYFLRSFIFFKKGSCQFLEKECTQVLVNRLQGFNNLSGKSVARWTDRARHDPII